MANPEAPNIGLDFSKYNELKARKKGGISLGLAGNSKTRAVMYKQQYDPEHGEELDPLMISVNPKALHASIAAFEAQIDGMKAMLEDLGKLGVDVSPPTPPEG
jgi:hypothetical protein